jgi:BirA family biotin operon repressor/biotin-[acetyl-CoA-carboxylase] ligase
MSENWSDLERPPLRQHQLRRALILAGSFFSDIRVVDETTSTNAELAESARGGAGEGSVLIAESQTRGRGRLERSWVSPPRAGLTFSVLFRPQFPASRWSWLPLLASVAVAQPLARLSGLDVRVKWPNDVLVGEHKVAGILAERVEDAVVVGIGLNVMQRRDELPGDSATSLVLAGSEILDRDPLLRSMLRSLARSYGDFHRAAGDPEEAGLRPAYAELCATVGCDVQVQLPGGRILEGRAVDVDVDGSLVIRPATGDLEYVAAGDVVHVR